MNTQTNTKHIPTTPLPWRISYDTVLPDGTKTESLLSPGTFPHFVAHCEGENRRADAEFICQAVNQHDTLIAQRDALREALQTIASTLNSELGAQEIARAALALCDKEGVRL